MSRHPFTNSCDFIRAVALNEDGSAKLSRADASQIRSHIAAAIGMEDAQLADILSLEYQKGHQ